MTPTLVRVPCLVCGADVPRRVASEGELSIVRCGSCDLLYVSPRMQNPQGHYHGVREAVIRKYGAILRGERSHNRDPNYRQELGVLRDLKPEGALLDIGTYCGFFLRMARGMGWTLTGVEPSAVGAQLAREFYGLDVKTATLHGARFADRSFDIATMVDVFEHVDDPLGMLAEVHRVLRDDGLLFVKVPNGRYNMFKYRLINRGMGLTSVEIFDAKEHVVHYTFETLQSTLALGGFGVKLALVPLPIQDGAAWKCHLRSIAYGIASAQHRLSGRFGPLATDIAVVAEKVRVEGTLALAPSIPVVEREGAA